MPIQSDTDNADPFLHGARRVDAQGDHAVGERLRILRLALGYDEKTMANLIGVSVATYRKYEAGSHIRNFENVAAFCCRHEIPLEWMLIGDGRFLPERVRSGTVAILPTDTPRSRKYREYILCKQIELWIKERIGSFANGKRLEIARFIYAMTDDSPFDSA